VPVHRTTANPTREDETVIATTHDLKAAARELLAAIDANQARTLPDLFAEHFVARLPGMPPLDRAAFQQFGQAFYAAFPDLHHQVEAQVAEGDTVTNRLLARGTHRGDFQGIPPTGRPVEIAAISIQRFAGGQLVEQHLLVDSLGLLQQIGAVPAPGQPPA
jgi:predicted ester cyclase